MGDRSRRKGASGECEIVALARSLGLPASREWQNAQHGDPTVRAVDVKIAGRPAQVKRAASGFSKLYDFPSNVELLFVRTNGREWIAVLAAEKLLKMLRGNENPIATHKQTESKDVMSAGAVEGHSEGHDGEPRWKRARRFPSIMGDDSGEQR